MTAASGTRTAPREKPAAERPASLRSGAGLAALLAVNGALVACTLAAGTDAVPGPLRMLAAALLVLVLPGVAWLGLLRGERLDAPRLALAVVGISSIAAVLGAAATSLLAGAPSRPVLLATLAVIANAGLLLGGPPPRLAAGTRWGVLAAVAGAGFLVIAPAALYLVPPLEDHDMEVRGTAWGLAADFTPYFLTNREIAYPFAHPLLFHFHVADSLTLTGEIGATRPSYDSARRALAATETGEPVPWMDWWRSDWQAFVSDPALTGTRAPGVLLAALVLALLADLVMRLTGSTAAGVAAAALYLSCPQTIVRSAYAGYFAVTVFAMLAAAMLFAPPAGRRTGIWLAVAGAFAALVDHKTVVLVLAVMAAALLHAAGEVWRRGAWLQPLLWRQHLDRRAAALVGGFAAGTFLWWGYAAGVDLGVFVRDHLRMHIAHRMLLNDVRLLPDASRYAPSILELWREFAAHTGWLLLPVALAGTALWMARGGELRRVLAAWFLTGAVLYTLTDWRQSKHLMNQLAPLAAAAVTVAWPPRRDAEPPVAYTADGRRRAAPLRWSAAAALVAAFAVNVAADVRLVRDFDSLRVLGASDVDGW